MRTKYFLSLAVLSLGIIISFILIDSTIAQIALDIRYPVTELDNCENEAACRAYCDKPENTKVCIDFAEKNNLMSKEEIRVAKKFIEVGDEGPGGCRGKEECEAFCNNTSHIDECIDFAEKNNLIPPEELEEAKKVQAAIRRGVKPPPCGGKKQCDVYCEDPNHMEECINFGIEAGFIHGKELEDVQKMLVAVKRGVKPPPCRGKEACDEYCSNPDNMELCMNFAIEAGFMSEQEKADSQKMLTALKKGIKPPDCRGKDECDIYCSQEGHFEECAKFAEAAGFMTPEEAEMARKTGGKGPGGCRGKEECEAFCNNPDNQETCFNFGKEHGLIPEEDLKMMEEGKQKFKESFNQMPAEVADCLKSLVGEAMFEKFKIGTAMPPREIGDQMRTCFEQFRPKHPEGMPIMPPRGMCGWCGDNCIKMEPEIACPAVMPPTGYICMEENGVCTRKEIKEGMRPTSGFEGQMPPEGMIMPPSDLRQNYNEDGFLNEMFEGEGNIPNQNFVPMPGQMPPEGMPSYGDSNGQMPMEGYRPPEGMMPPQDQMMPYMPPSDMPSNYDGTMPPEGFTPPPADFTPPSSFEPMPAPVEPTPVESLPSIGSIFLPILNLFQIY